MRALLHSPADWWSQPEQQQGQQRGGTGHACGAACHKYQAYNKGLMGLMGDDASTMGSGVPAFSTYKTPPGYMTTLNFNRY